MSRRTERLTTLRSRSQRAALDLVERNLTAELPDRLWVDDITDIPTWAGFLYPAVVLDAFSRRIIGGSMATHLPTELVHYALKMAPMQRRRTDVIHHSDQSCHDLRRRHCPLDHLSPRQQERRWHDSLTE